MNYLILVGYQTLHCVRGNQQTIANVPLSLYVIENQAKFN